MEPPSKRQLRPTSSLPTTAEKYGAQYGLPDELQRKLQDVGPKGRYSVAQGRTFDRTQSYPAIASTSGSSSSFQTTSEIHAQAEQLISKERLRARELKPYSDTLDVSTSSPSSSPPKRTLTLEHNSRKRRSSPAEPEERSGSDTEVENDDDDMPDLTFTSASTDDFPPVFTSPKITQPELFAKQVMPSKQASKGRLMKSLPGGGRRGFGKTVSAPVIGTMGWSGMEVDDREVGGLVDGFDVKEWAASEEF